MQTVLRNLLLPVILMPGILTAATLVESQDVEGPQKMWVEGNKMRVQMDANGDYMLADYTRKKVYFIVPSKRELIDMSDTIHSSKNNNHGLHVQVDYVGKGPNIAGYSTKKYNLSVNGQACEQVLVSKQAMKDARLQGMMKNLDAINFDPMGGQFMNDCDRADGLFARKMTKLGMPMGSIERDGRMRGKVTLIKKNATLPEGGFTLPKGYRRITMQQKMQEAMGNMMPPSMPVVK